MITELADHLKPLSTFTPCPPASDRSAWDSLPSDYKARLIKEGEKYLNFQFPSIPMTDFMAFNRTGNRVIYENKQFARRTILDALVLAECAEYQGRFLDDIINALFLICEETAWQLPAHNCYIKDTPQFLLPDVTRPVVDLFAAETGAVLAVAEYVLRDALAAVSPAISTVINHNLTVRVFEPYLTEHFWWMGDGKTAVNNWTSWCTQNVLLAAFTRENGWMPDFTDFHCRNAEEWQNLVFQKACRSLDYFLDEYGEDGCCDEGAQYYRHAGLTFFNCLEVLNGITNHGFDPVYQEPKVRNMAAYIFNVHIAGQYYVNFADCSPVAGRCNVREYLFGKRTGNPKLMAFAAQDYRASEDPLTLDEHNLFYRLQTVFTHEEMMAYGNDIPVSHPDIFYPSVGLFLTRDDHYCLAVKAGDNGDSHNHNDTGSFTIYKDGKPLFIDVGVESYTKKTFSPQRYEIWAMQSRYHNLLTFGDIMQKDGEEYGARDVAHTFTAETASISMDVAPAYPECKELHSYIRKAVLEKNKRISIVDTISWENGTDGPAADSKAVPVVLSLMTYEKPELVLAPQADAESDFHGDTYQMSIGTLGTCRIAGCADVKTEEIPITDQRLGLMWKHSIYRTLVTLADKQVGIYIEELRRE